VEVVDKLGLPINLADAVCEGLSDLDDGAVWVFGNATLSKFTTTGAATGTWISFLSPILGVTSGENMEVALGDR
jgi:hypothetical protein